MKLKLVPILATVLLAGALTAAVSTNTMPSYPAFSNHLGGLVRVLNAGPVDDQFFTCVANAKLATANPYRPGAATGTTPLSVVGYTGVIVRAKYSSAASLTTDPVVRVWGLKGSDWVALADIYGVTGITLADDAADCDDGTSKWTAPTGRIDALGCSAVKVTVATAAVSSGAVSLELSRY